MISILLVAALAAFQAPHTGNPQRMLRSTVAYTLHGAGNLAVPRFNPALGVLDRVEIRQEVHAIVWAYGENCTGSAAQFGWNPLLVNSMWVADGGAPFIDSGGAVWSTMSSPPVPAFDGVIDYQGPSFFFVAPVNVAGSSLYVASGASALYHFIGTGTLPFHSGPWSAASSSQDMGGWSSNAVCNTPTPPEVHTLHPSFATLNQQATVSYVYSPW